MSDQEKEPSAPATESEKDASGAQPAAETAKQGAQSTDTPQPGDKPPEEKRVPWFERRIAELTAKYREEQRQRLALEAILSAPANAGTPPPGATPQTAPPVLTPQEFDTRVAQRAAELAAQQALNEASNRTYEVGKSKYSDFDNAVQAMRNVADLSQTPHFLEAVTKLPNGADVYYHLGTHLDDAAHVLSLSPVQMALELARISASVGKPPAQSKAAPPITPVSGAAGDAVDLDDKLSVEEWMRRREKQLSSR